MHEHVQSNTAPGLLTEPTLASAEATLLHKKSILVLTSKQDLPRARTRGS